MVHHLLPHRPYLCLSQETFAVAEVAVPWKCMRLPQAVADELMTCCLLGGEAVAPLSAPLCPKVSATDALWHHGAVVEADCSLEEVAWLWSRASLRGAYSRELVPCYINPGGELVPADQLLSDWVGGVQFRELVAYKLQRLQHIDLLEGGPRLHDGGDSDRQEPRISAHEAHTVA